MKRLLALLPIMVLISIGTNAQKINYENTFEHAKNLARSQNKPLALLVTIAPPPNVTYVLEGFKDQAVIDKFNNSFINFKIDRAEPGASEIIGRFNITHFPSIVFLDSKGGIMLHEFGNMRSAKLLLAMAEKGIAASSEKSLAEYDNEYLNGAYDNVFLKDYILKRRNLGITANAFLIDKYINTLSVADLNDYKQVLFILQAGPVIDSKAYRLSRLNDEMYDSIFKTEPFDVRVAINNAIIDNSMAKAIKIKDEKAAYAVAAYTSGTWGSDPETASKNYDLKMLQYYKGIKDTDSYLSRAVMFYDRYYMNILADSVKKIEEARNARIKANANANPGEPFRYSIKVSTVRNESATVLNNGAYAVYETGTTDPFYLNKAVLWVMRSIEQNPVSFSYDTYAHLLYRLGAFTDAEKMQQKAIELAVNVEKQNDRKLQEELSKMKNRTL